MVLKLRKYEIVIALIVMVNVLIFVYLSRRFERYVTTISAIDSLDNLQAN